MEDKTPDTQASLDRLLSEVGDLLQIIQKIDSPLNITPEIATQIKQFEKAFGMIDEIYQENFNQTLPDIEKLKEEVIDSDSNLPQKEKQFFNRAKLIERDARKLQLAYSKALERGKKSGAPENDAARQKRKERRKLFKPLGGDRNWIPL